MLRCMPGLILKRMRLCELRLTNTLTGIWRSLVVIMVSTLTFFGIS